MYDYLRVLKEKQNFTPKKISGHGMVSGQKMLKASGPKQNIPVSRQVTNTKNLLNK
jgi:hypothetical protein